MRAVVVGLGVFLATIAIGLRWPVRYRSTAVLRVYSFAIDSKKYPPEPYMESIRSEVFGDALLKQAATEYLRVFRKESPGVQEMREAIAFSATKIGERFQIALSFDADDPIVAQSVVQTLVTQQIDNSARRSPEFPVPPNWCAPPADECRRPGFVTELLDPASLPGPRNMILWSAVGGCLGALAGVAESRFRRLIPGLV